MTQSNASRTYKPTCFVAHESYFTFKTRGTTACVRMYIYTYSVYIAHVFFFLIPFMIFAFPCSLPRRNSDPGSHSRLFSPLPSTVRALHFYRENSLAVASLVDPRRIVPTHARRSQQLIPFFLQIH